MVESSSYIDSYDLRKVILFGAAGSSGVIFSFLFLAFLGSRGSSHHQPISTDTIGEMMGYAEFFFFAFVSYFAAAVFVWKMRSLFSNSVISWIPISSIGSMFFSISFFSWVWFLSVPSPQGVPPPSFMYVLLFAMVCGVALTVITGVSSAIASAWNILETSQNEIVPK